MPKVVQADILYQQLVEDGSILPPLDEEAAFKRTTRQSVKRKLGSEDYGSDEDSDRSSADSLLLALDRAHSPVGRKDSSKEEDVSMASSGDVTLVDVHRQLVGLHEKLDRFINASTEQRADIEKVCYYFVYLLIYYFRKFWYFP